MRNTIPTAARGASLACAVLAAFAAACTTVAPATPVLVSIQGNGTSSPTSTAGVEQFRFNFPTWNATTQVLSAPVASTVRFSVPYPTALELSINGKPLTSSAQPLSRNYEYAGEIENPGANPVTWRVEIRTPFDVPYAQDPGGQVAYELSVVDAAGSARSQPLKILYRQPQAYVPQIFTASSGNSSTTSSSPPSASRSTGPCAGGAQEQAFSICWRKANVSPYTAGTTACSYSEAVRMLTNSYPGYSSSPGPC